MSGCQRDSVPSAVIAPLIQEWLDSDPYMESASGEAEVTSDVSGNSLPLLSERSGVSRRKLYMIMKGKGMSNGKGVTSHNISFDTADRLLCAMHMQNRWLVELAEHYGPISVLPYEYGFEMPVTESECGTSESWDEGCRCKSCRDEYSRARMREYNAQRTAA